MYIYIKDFILRLRFSSIHCIDLSFSFSVVLSMFFFPLICDLIFHYSYSDQIYTLFFLSIPIRPTFFCPCVPARPFRPPVGAIFVA